MVLWLVASAALAPLLPSPPASPRRGLRAVAYLRVSTDRQADRGHGLEVQEAAVRAWARANRARIAYVCRDEGRSGADAINRPGLAAALGHLRAGRADVLIVSRLDRLARDLVLTEWLRAEVLQHGAQLRSTDPVEDLHLREDPDNPTGKLVRRILGAIADYERDLIRLRMSAGKAAKVQAGGYAHGRPPYGWRAERGELVRDLDEQRVIARMRRWRRAGLSYRQIVTKLTDAGDTTRSGSRWTPQGVARVIERTMTKGPDEPGPINAESESENGGAIR